MTERKYLTGLVGSGIGESLSPALHEHEAAAHGIDYQYHLFDLDLLGAEAGEIIQAARTLGYAGVNVTHPVKQSILAELDQVSDEARQIGAVNTVVFTNAGFVGHNTDAYGFAQLATHALAGEATDRVVQFGAGGAGAAVAHAQLTQHVGHLAVVDVCVERATGLVESLRRRFGVDRVSAAGPEQTADLLASADGFVNATPMGMAAHPGTAIDTGLLNDRHWVIDIVYMPLETQLMREATARGARVTSGIGMTAFQAAAAFEHFTGITADEARMLADMKALVATRLART